MRSIRLLALALSTLIFCPDFDRSAALAQAPAAKPPLLKGSAGGEKKRNIKDNAEIPADMHKAMDDLVLEQAKLLGGSEYEKDREFGRGAMNSCLTDCFVVLYLLEGVPSRHNKNSAQFMAAYTYIAGKPLLLGNTQVGGRGLRYVNLQSIGPDNIKLTTETYLPKDNLSNPTGRGHATYVIAGKHLIETP